MSLKSWSTTAASNVNANTGIDWDEGMSPAQVNNSARSTMADVKAWWDQIDGGTVSNGTVGGTASAITLTVSPTIDAYRAGQRYLFALGSDISGATTLNVDGLGAKAVQWRGAALASGYYSSGDRLLMEYDGTQMQIIGPIPRILLEPNRPCFQAYNSADDANVTGDGTAVTIEFDTEVFDRGSNYNNTSDTFTAPVAGVYLLSAKARLTGLGASHTGCSLAIVTSNRSYQKFLNPGAMRDSNNKLTVDLTVLADMDAADTANVSVTISGGTKAVTIEGATEYTSFFGKLEA